MNMRKFYFLSIIAGTMFAYSSCSNDLVEEVSEEVSEHVQKGTPMNFALELRDNDKNHDSRKVKHNFNYNDNAFSAASVDFKWEEGDVIGVDCPNADTQDGRKSQAAYKVVKSPTGDDPSVTSDLKCVSQDYLYWGEDELHRVFCAYPQGKVVLGDIQDADPWDPTVFSRTFTATIERVQIGNVSEETIREGNIPVQGYRAISKENMICGGYNFFFKEWVTPDQVITLPFNAFFTSADVIFTPEEVETPKKITIKEVKISVDESQIDYSQFSQDDVKISGTCTGTIGDNGSWALSIKQIAPTPGSSYNDVTLKVNGNDGFAWPQDKPLSTVLIMFPSKEPENSSDSYTRTFPAKLTVKYQYENEVEQTKVLNITNNYYINARNRIKIPALPHAE